MSMQALAHNVWTPHDDALMLAGRPTKSTRPSFGERLVLARQQAGRTQQQRIIDVVALFAHTAGDEGA